MASETFNLAILLSLKDGASGGLTAFGSNLNKQSSQAKTNLEKLTAAAKQQATAIEKEFGKQSKGAESFTKSVANVDKLRDAGRQKAIQSAATLSKQTATQVKELETLSETLRKSGNSDAARQADKLANSIKNEIKVYDQLGYKLKEIDRLRKFGSEKSNNRASMLEGEVKQEIKQLDNLAGHLREVAELRKSTTGPALEVKNVQSQMQQYEAATERMQELREKLGRDVALGGAGVAGLVLLKKGADEAGNYEEAMLDLRQAYQENAKFSQFSSGQQESQIKRIGALATELGNKYQGSTADYVNMFTAMNKAGIDAETTLNGAGKAAAYLANLTGAIRVGQAPQLAEDLGSYGKMFDLQGDDYLRAVETFSAIKDRFNLDSGSIIEASKYFFSTAKGTMNLRGSEGAIESAKLLAFAKRFAGREGSDAGTALDALMTQFIAHDEARRGLEKDKGIKLEFFNEKGEFGGVENMFRQLEKMRTLNPEERASRLNGIFGEQGSRIASAMVEQGADGWKNITAEMNKAVSVQTLIEQKMDTYNAKTEALSGSWQNFKATAFTPLMGDLKSFLDKGNEAVSWLQKVSSENQGLTKTVTTIAGLASGALVLVGGFRAMSTAWQMWRLASSVANGTALTTYLGQTSVAANTASASMSRASTQATGLRGRLSALGSNSTVKIGVQIAAVMGIEYLLGIIQSEIQKAIDAGNAKKGAMQAAQANYQTFQNAERDGVKFNPQDFEGQASTTWFTAMNQGLKYTLPSKFENSPLLDRASYVAKSTYLSPLSRATGSTNPFAEGFFGRNTMAEGFKKTTPELADPRIMTAFLRQLETRVPDKNEQQDVKQALATAFPESFSSAMRELAGLSFAPLTQGVTDLTTQISAQTPIYQTQNQTLTTMNESLTNLQQPITQTGQNFTNLGNTINQVPPPLTRVATSAGSAANNLDGLSNKIANWQMPTPNVQTFQIGVPTGGNAAPTGNPLFTVPGRAVGGVVERDGLAQVHAGNVITPARITHGLNMGGLAKAVGEAQTARAQSFAANTVSINYSPNVTINGASPTAKQDFQGALNDHSKHIERLVTRIMQNGRVRS